MNHVLQFHSVKRFVCLLALCLVSGCTTANTRGVDVKKIITSRDSVCASLNSEDDTTLISYYCNDGKTGIYQSKDGKRESEIKGVSYGTVSPNGKFHTYIQKNELLLLTDKDKLIKKYPVDTTRLDKVSWSWDSKYIYIGMNEEKENVYRIDTRMGGKERVFSCKYCSKPIATKQDGILYMLQQKVQLPEPSDNNIIKYNIHTKEFERVKIPNIKDLYIYEDFSVSPNGKIVIFQSNKEIYAVDIDRQKVIEKFVLPGFKFPDWPEVGDYCWKSDSSYVIFSCYMEGSYGIYKYVVPKNY